MIDLIILFGLFFVLIALGMPIAFAMGISAIVVLVTGLKISAPIVATKMIGSVDSWAWLAIPLFIFMGNLMTITGTTKRMVAFSMTVVGHIRGGLSHVSVVTNILLAGMSGSLAADAAAVGSIFGNTMKEAGYPPGYTAAIVASGAIIGPMIPPSICFILVGGAGNISILRLWLGGAIPGLLIGFFLIVTGYMVARKRGFHAEEKCSWSQRGKTLIPALPALAIPVLIIGGMRFGLFTAVEAGAVGFVYTLIIGMAIYREAKLTDVFEILLQSAKAASKTLFIIATASAFSWVLTILRADSQIMEIVGSFATPTSFLLITAFVFTILGFFLDGPPLVLIFIPILVPVAVKIGLDPVHFGVLFGLVNVVGAVTPPMAVSMYMTCSLTGASVSEYVRDGWPAIVPLFLVILLVIFIPPIVLFLPNLIMGS